MRWGRNEPCLCGGGLKYKRCCLDRELAQARVVTERAATGRAGAEVAAGAALGPRTSRRSRAPGERPSLETVADWVEDGYAHWDDLDPEQACASWWKVWELVRVRVTAGLRRLDGQALVAGTELSGEWLAHLVILLASQAGEDRERAAQGIEVGEWILARFPDEPAGSRRSLQGLVATLYLEADRPADAEALFQRVIEESPDEAEGYIGLAIALTPPFPGAPQAGGLRKDAARAIRLLQQAMRRPVRDAAEWDLNGRLAQLMWLRDEEERARTAEVLAAAGTRG